MSISIISEPATVASFFQYVIAPFKVSMAGVEHGYSEYLALPADSRSNDEADVVDIRFAQGVLEWLGFHKAEGYFTYNRTSPRGPGGSLRPDFTAHGAVGTAFIWEDKNTADGFGEEHVQQLQKYVVGTVGYAVWSNARTMIGFRFDARGQHQRLVEVDVETLCNPVNDTDEKKKQEAALDLFYLLFSRQRFTSFESLLDSICVDEPTFLNQAQSLVGASARTQFVAGGQQVLGHLRLAALQQIQLGLRQQEVISDTEAALSESATRPTVIS